MSCIHHHQDYSNCHGNLFVFFFLFLLNINLMSKKLFTDFTFNTLDIEFKVLGLNPIKVLFNGCLINQ